MLKVIRKQTALFLVLTLLATTMATAQTVNMNKYITLTVQQGQQIQLDLMAAAAGTPVKIVSGSTEQTITVGTDWTDFQNYTAGSTTMTVYGDITGFDCSGNGAKLTALNVSHNTALTQLYCNGNQLTSLNVSQNTALTVLYCYDNQLTSLNVSQNTALTGLDCGYNQLTSLDVSHNTALTGLYCRSNQLTSLDVSQNTALTALYCVDNQITALDVSQNTALVVWWCYGNNFTTQAFNDLMCSLPARTTADDAKFYPLYNASDAGASAFMAANAQIAKDKNWQVCYVADGAEIPATTGTYTCPVVNMSRYITLTVQQGQQIQLDLQAAAAGTPVKIVSGSTEREVTVSTSWTGFQNYTAGSTTMTVYGDITGFDCRGNGTKLTALNVSHNTALTQLYCNGNQLTSLNVSQNTALIELNCSDNQLTALDVSHNTALTRLDCWDNQLTSLDVSQNTALVVLWCYGNNFTTEAFNTLMCSLPARVAADDAKFYPLYNASDTGASAFMAANAQIATAKNWQVRYVVGGDIPPTTGTYTCPVVNMSRYITLTVTQGQQIRLDFKAAAAGTPVKIVSGSTETEVTVGTSWTGFQNYTAGATTMTVYGDITGFSCGGNRANLTAIDISHNTALTALYCGDNQLTSLNVSQNTALTGLNCSSNQLTSLDVSQNTALTWLYCYGNQITALNVSHNTELTALYCGSNQLTSLDVSQNTALTELLCSGNSFTTQAFNDLMCSLPARTTANNARFYPLYNASDAGASAFMATNAQIAKDKNWQVRYWESEAAIPATTGTYVCGTGIAEIASVPLSVYPNPATDILTVETETTGSVITLTDLTGRTVLTATATAGKTVLNLSELSAGTYIVHVGDRVGKVIKN